MPTVPAIPPFTEDPVSMLKAMEAMRDVLNGLLLAGSTNWYTILTGIQPLLVSRDPVLALELATKQYADAAGGALTAAQILALLLTVDGAGSGLDADLLDGGHGSFYQNASNLNSGILLPARFNDTSHGNRGGGALHPAVIAAGANGFMTGADKTLFNISAQLNHGWNGSLLQDPIVVFSSDGAQWTLTLTAAASPLGCLFDGIEHNLVVSPAVSVNLAAGVDDSTPQVNYIFLTESGGTVTLATNTTGYPLTAHIKIGDCLLQTAANGAIIGPIQSHQHSEHISRVDSGMIVHITEKLRETGATHASGLAPIAMVVSAPDAYLGVEVGRVHQLHPHTFPAKSMPGNVFLVINDPTTPYKQITSLDEITQDASGGAINNRHFSLVMWGSQNDGDTGQVYINLPTGTYSTTDKAAADVEKYAVFNIPAIFKGTGVLMGEYIVEGKTSGTWVQNGLKSLLGQVPSTSPGGGPGVTDHADLSSLTGVTGHTGLLATDGSRTASHLQFDLAFAGAIAEGQLNWNAIDGTFEYGLPGGNVTLQLGQEFLIKAVNKTGITINDGEIVYISGASGSRPEISLADASDSAKDEPVGMATEDIAHNDSGYVNVAGLVRGIDTSSIAVGNPGYLSATTPGALSATPSAGAHHNTVVGYCLFSNASSGVFLVRVTHVPPHDASTTEAGIIEIATQAEVDAETDAVRAVTPETLAVYVGANSYSHPNHSGDVTSVGDGAQTIASNAVTNAKAANMVQARIKGRASGAGTGDPTDLTAAQARTVLNVENGAEVNNISDANATDLTDGGETSLHSHAGGGGGALIPLSTQTIGGAVASVSVESGIDITYNMYLWQIIGLTVTVDDRGMRLTLGDAGGYKSTLYAWAFHSVNSNLGDSVDGANSDAHIELIFEDASGQGMGNAAGESGVINIWLTNPAETSNYKMVKFDVVHVNNIVFELDGGAQWKGTTALTKMKLTPESGNIDGGIATLYGVANA